MKDPKPAQMSAIERRAALGKDLEDLFATVWRLDRAAREWGWLNDPRPATHICRVPEPGETTGVMTTWSTSTTGLTTGSQGWTCPECRRRWYRELDGDWTRV